MGIHHDLKVNLDEVFNDSEIIQVSAGIMGPHVQGFLNSNETFDEVRRKGFFSLKPGFYRIDGEIGYKPVSSGFQYPTHFEQALFTSDGSIVYRYPVNLGPLSSTTANFTRSGDTFTDNIPDTFIENKQRLSTEDYYKASKDVFYKELNTNGVVLWVKKMEFTKGMKKYTYDFIA